ncbi:tyrosine protein phosphatase 1 [Polychaeton citri CBS 116435]|uniref:Tyrosine protein phosphatase 1 n=1 Tax=Polychaeton citri CBS 116435 TaxID=1314669 RepID=A0A9P4UM99_9PEZI|nr:tyrosine protein phosphatase 1 [Polychaeton citri CBS 116435]
MATLCATRPAALSENRTPTPPPLPSINTSQRGIPSAVPNKHIPFCSPGPRPSSRQLDTPPASPPSPSQVIETVSLTYPPVGYTKILNDPPVYSISAAKLQQALDHLASQPLPSPKQVFPWLHGLHADNQVQLAFLIARRRSLRKTPRCIRGLTIVKAGRDISHSRLKGAVAPEEVIQCPRIVKSKEADEGWDFLDLDPKDGFSVRNFQIQAAKMATVSDIVVYGDTKTPKQKVEKLARRIAKAQASWQKKMDPTRMDRQFNTFVLSDDFDLIETDYPDLVCLDSEGCVTNKVMDFFHQERVEMSTMSAPTQISRNVWLGPTPDPSLGQSVHLPNSPKETDFDIMIDANDLAQVPDASAFNFIEELIERRDNKELEGNYIPQLDFPGSGAILPPTWSHAEVDGLVETCAWMYRQANGTGEKKRRDSKMALSSDQDADGDSVMQDDETEDPPQRKILIHCQDGYTESSMLALAYYMYAECKPVHDAWLEMHTQKGRNFFAYGSDVSLLRAIQPRLLQSSPKYIGDVSQLCPAAPEWLDKMDGSLPSRILPYMYLGNLGHANNPSLLNELGIGQILSVGEPISWSREVAQEWSKENLLYIDKVQDNGVDPLTEEFGRCLDFIENGRKQGKATLVHCRVGVSRSATICIAEVMNELGLSFPRAYCFVRARRLNVIIQPHLRFSYELLKWEEFQCQKRGKPVRRELEWATIAREIAAMNKPYSKQNQ